MTEHSEHIHDRLSPYREPELEEHPDFDVIAAAGTRGSEEPCPWATPRRLDKADHARYRLTFKRKEEDSYDPCEKHVPREGRGPRKCARCGNARSAHKA